MSRVEKQHSHGVVIGVLLVLLVLYTAGQRVSGGVFVHEKLWPAGTTLRVCFFDGEPALRATVVAAFTQWLPNTPLQIDVGDPARPQTCTRDGTYEIRVSFTGKGNYSFVGTDAANIVLQREPTIMLGGAKSDALALTTYHALHEFGHALGLLHEDTHPDSTCTKQINIEEALKVSGSSLEAFQMSYGTAQDTGLTPFDSDSVMQLGVPATWLFEPDSSCEPKFPTSLSPGDQTTIAMIYRGMPIETLAPHRIQPREFPIRAQLLREGIVTAEHFRQRAAYLLWSLRRGQKSSRWNGLVQKLFETIEARAVSDPQLAPVFALLAHERVEEAKSGLQEAANNAGNVTARLLLSKWYFNGKFFQKSFSQSSRYARAAAEQGDLDGALLLALFEIGGVVSQGALRNSSE